MGMEPGFQLRADLRGIPEGPKPGQHPLLWGGGHRGLRSDGLCRLYALCLQGKPDGQLFRTKPGLPLCQPPREGRYNPWQMMQKILRYSLIVFLVASVGGCNTKKKEDATAVRYECPMHCEGEKTYGAPGSCPVCKMDLVAVGETPKMEAHEGEISELSIYNLPSVWTTQDEKEIELKELQGDVVVMVMVYTSCKAACPRLAADMREIEKQI